MMEVINNFIGTVYYRANVDDEGNKIDNSSSMLMGHADDALLDEDDGQAVKWFELFKIKRFPKALVDKTSVPYLFSPNFTYMIDFNFRAKQFMIRECATQNVYMRIPKDLLNTDWNGKTGDSSIKIICSRLTWLSERVLHIINEENLDSYFEMCTTDPSDQEPDARYLKLLSSVKIDNLIENQIKRDSPHLIKHRF